MCVKKGEIKHCAEGISHNILMETNSWLQITEVVQ